jgi:CRISPR system Cascade subunit CasC
MKIELHLIQNFAPSNLNRDDTGAPKDCELGGHRRARISSQCQKRAMRDVFRLRELLAEDELGTRTKRLIHRVVDTLVDEYDLDRQVAADLAVGAIEGIGLGRNKKAEGEDAWKTQYLLFVPRRIVKELAALLYKHRDILQSQNAESSEVAPADEAGAGKKGKKTAKQEKKAAAAAYPKEVQKAVESLLDGARSSVDMALFGRMIADKPDWNIEAACQIAHAISTNRVQMDFDFFTAVDDFKPGDTAGSDMMGTIQFNSSCFYRYAVLDVDALRENLDTENEQIDHLMRRSIDAFVRAFVSAIPTAKQNGMAAHNFPSYALAIVRDSGQSISLANAFLKPARPRGEEVDLVDDSVTKLETYLDRMRELLEADPLLLTWADRDLSDVEGIERTGRLADFFARITTRAVEART